MPDDAATGIETLGMMRAMRRYPAALGPVSGNTNSKQWSGMGHGRRVDPRQSETPATLVGRKCKSDP